MKEKTLNIRNIEFIVFLVIWVAVFAIPFFNQRISNEINWNKVTSDWITMLSLLTIFLINAFLLVPAFLFQKKYTAYFAFSLLVILLVIALKIYIVTIVKSPQPLAMPPMELGPGMPPMELGPGMPPPMGYKPVTPLPAKSLFMVFVDNLILSLLVVGVGTAFKMVTQWLNEESRRKDLEKEQLKTELALLRHQVSPHFFMNTLNNIHALIDINTEDAKNTIIQLSTMMRYLLYDTAHGKTSLKKEIAFIKSYIALMKLRFPETVVVTLNVPEDVSNIEIPPMLFISFLENAFKHGVSYHGDSFVLLSIEQKGNKLNCIVRNSKFRKIESAEKSYSGIGMANIKKSLKLLFGEDYTLAIRESETEFEVKLTVPVYENKMLSN